MPTHLKDTVFYKARSPQDIVEYADQVLRSLKLNKVPFLRKK